MPYEFFSHNKTRTISSFSNFLTEYYRKYRIESNDDLLSHVKKYCKEWYCFSDQYISLSYTYSSIVKREDLEPQRYFDHPNKSQANIINPNKFRLRDPNETDAEFFKCLVAISFLYPELFKEIRDVVEQTQSASPHFLLDELLDYAEPDADLPMPKIYTLPYDELPIFFRQILRSYFFYNHDHFVIWCLSQRSGCDNPEQPFSTWLDIERDFSITQSEVEAWQKESKELDVTDLHEYKMLFKHSLLLEAKNNEFAKDKSSKLREVFEAVALEKFDKQLTTKSKASPVQELLAGLKNNQQIWSKAQNSHGVIKNWLHEHIGFFKPVKTKELADALVVVLERQYGHH